MKLMLGKNRTLHACFAWLHLQPLHGPALEHVYLINFKMLLGVRVTSTGTVVGSSDCILFYPFIVLLALTSVDVIAVHSSKCKSTHNTFS